ncbi:hypothetical protein LPJ66_005277, partial [Kickxella alabastrina]
MEHIVVFFAFVSPIAAFIASTYNESMRGSYMSAGFMAIFYPVRFLRLHVVHSGVNWYSQANNLQSPSFTFLDAIYFIAMNSLDPNDSIPQNTFSIVISMAIVALIAFAVPSRVTRLVDLALKTSAYNKFVALPKASRHAVVCGHIELEPIRQFLHEFFNADHGPNIFNTTLVILHSEDPSMEMKAMLQDPAYANRVFYVKGRATSFSTLKKARVDLATCIYILARKHSHGSGIEEDAETVLIALALSAFGISGNQVRRIDGRLITSSRKFQVFAQTLLPGSISHLAYLQTTRVMCVDEMRMGIMAQNCATPGFAALAYMLSTSVANHSDWDYTGVLNETIAKSAEDSWVKSYIHGISQEIYQVHVPKSLVGKSFFKATRYFYRCHGILIFSVGSFSQSRAPLNHMAHHPSFDIDSGYYQILLAPHNYTLEKHDMLFAISTDVQSVLNAMVYAERVSIRSANIEKSNVRSNTARLKIEVRSPSFMTNTPPPSPQLPLRRHLIGLLSVSNSARSTAAAMPAENKSLAATIEEGIPVQMDSPRRMIAKPPGASNQRKSYTSNYISDSDSSYFSPGRKTIETVVHSSTYPPSVFPINSSATAQLHHDKFEGRRGDLVPQDIRDHIVICDASNLFPRNVELLVQALK